MMDASILLTIFSSKMNAQARRHHHHRVQGDLEVVISGNDAFGKNSIAAPDRDCQQHTSPVSISVVKLALSKNRSKTPENPRTTPTISSGQSSLPGRKIGQRRDANGRILVISVPCEAVVIFCPHESVTAG